MRRVGINDRVGRTRIKLIELLNKELNPLGYYIKAEDIQSTTGYYRQKVADCVAWEGNAYRIDNNLVRGISSWNTMTELVKYGLVVVINSTLTPTTTGVHIEVHRKN